MSLKNQIKKPKLYKPGIVEDYLQGFHTLDSTKGGGTTYSGTSNSFGNQNITETDNKTEKALADYKNQLKLDTANVQSEIMSANKLANQYLQNYLKQQGILGTGIGQSQYTNLATNYANQMAQAKIDEQTKYQQALKEYQQGRTEELATLLSTMSADERESYLQEVAKTEGLEQRYLDTLATQSKVLSSQEAEKGKEFVKSLIDYGAEGIVIQKAIDDLKAKNVDTRELEMLAQAVGSDVTTQAYKLWEDLENMMSSENFDKNKRTAYEDAVFSLKTAISSGDTKQIKEAIEYANKLSVGLDVKSPLNSQTNSNAEKVSVVPSDIKVGMNVDNVKSGGGFKIVSIKEGWVQVEDRDGRIFSLCSVEDFASRINTGHYKINNTSK